MMVACVSSPTDMLAYLRGCGMEHQHRAKCTIRGKSCYKNLFGQSVGEQGMEKGFAKNGVPAFLTGRDVACMGVLTLVFAFLAFFRIGNTYEPQTGYAVPSENRDIVLDFGEYVGISSVSMFLNCQANRHFTLSAYNEVTKEWELFDEEALAPSVFAWNKLDVNYRLRYLGIVVLDEGTILNELVAVTADGDVLLPANASDYPELFDEQSMFPAHNTYLDGTMFDEVYHGRTAYEFLHGLPTYETTHPHLGKILIALGIRVFGMHPFGMRVASALFGILMVPLFYLFAKRLFSETFFAAATTALLVLDCMHLMLSRIATIDIFAAFFIVLMYYFLYRYLAEDSAYRRSVGRVTLRQAFASRFLPWRVALPLALCGISMGLGIATKWTGVYAGIGLAILFFTHLATHFPGKQTFRLFLFCCVFFVAIPLLLYVLCFFPVVTSDGSATLVEKAIRGTQSMFRYHANLTSDHYYGSRFNEWPILWRPLLDACDDVGNGKVSAVSCMGNPIIWWAGLLCVCVNVFLWITRKDKKAMFLSIAYLAQYVPWMFISRTTFIYHYFPSSLFMMLCMGHTMEVAVLRFPKKGKVAACAFLAAAGICFVLFYPVVSGYPIDREWGLHLRWLKNWVLVL